MSTAGKKTPTRALPLTGPWGIQTAWKPSKEGAWKAMGEKGQLPFSAKQTLHYPTSFLFPLTFTWVSAWSSKRIGDEEPRMRICRLFIWYHTPEVEETEKNRKQQEPPQNRKPYNNKRLDPLEVPPQPRQNAWLRPHVPLIHPQDRKKLQVLYGNL